MTFDDAYFRAVHDVSDINEHVPFIAGLVAEREATTVIELGTRSGVSTTGWLYGLEKTDGHLYSVDLDPPPELPFATERWTFLQGDDLAPGIVKRLPDADIVFIDTSHTYDQTFAELSLYQWKLKPGGVFVLHDTELMHPMDAPKFPRFPVKRAIEDFCADEGLSWVNRPNCNGLGVIST